MSASSTERYERLLKIQSLVNQISREIGPALDLDTVLARVLSALRSLVAFEGGAIALLQDDHLVVSAADPPPDGNRVPFRLPTRGISADVLRSGRSEVSDDLRTDPRVSPEMRDLARDNGVAGFLCVPLVCLGDVIGVITVHSSQPGTFGDEEQVLLEGLAIQVAGAIESARRYEMITDLEVLKSDFIARVSHELRTPITIMSGFVSTLLTNHERLDVDTRQRMLERVDVATARLSGLIDQLLMLSRLEAGVVAASIEPVELAAVLEEVRRQAASPEAVTIECPEGHTVRSDPQLLVRGLGFLVDNALKYAGSCRIRAEGAAILVTDRGPGIPLDRRSQVFERFTRVNQDTTVAGMGVGLPMARTVLAAAGAELAAEDPPDGIGTQMAIRFW